MEDSQDDAPRYAVLASAELFVEVFNWRHASVLRKDEPRANRPRNDAPAKACRKSCYVNPGKCHAREAIGRAFAGKEPVLWKLNIALIPLESRYARLSLKGGLHHYH
jgi:hypothetical protein